MTVSLNLTATFELLVDHVDEVALCTSSGGTQNFHPCTLLWQLAASKLYIRVCEATEVSIFL
jgi:hypothetical protein